MTCAIPEGVIHGETARLNIGEQYIFIKFEIMNDSVFSRDGLDVMQRIRLPLSTGIIHCISTKQNTGLIQHCLVAGQQFKH